MTDLPERVMVVVGGNFDGRWVREEELLTATAEQERFKVGMNVWKDAWNEKALQADNLRAKLLDAERERDESASRPVPPDSGRVRYPMTDIRRDFIHRALTYPGFVGDRDLFVDVARDLAARVDALTADKEALVALFAEPHFCGAPLTRSTEGIALSKGEVMVKAKWYHRLKAILGRVP